MLHTRCVTLNHQESVLGSVIYWMSREQRVLDNWALLFAQKEALKMKVPLYVVFCYLENYLGASARQNDFMLRGLKETQARLSKFNIPFILLEGKANLLIPEFIKTIKAGLLVTDFSPLKISRKFKDVLSHFLDIPFIEVDSHNIVPCFIASSKAEHGPFSIRAKINKHLDFYMKDIEKPILHPYTSNLPVPEIQWDTLISTLLKSTSTNPLNIASGEEAAYQIFNNFIRSKLDRYKYSTDPNANTNSGLSPYLRFGQISSQRIALMIKKYGMSDNGFFEQLIINKELSDNFCFYNKDYDSVKGFPYWAQKTLEFHMTDKKLFKYKFCDFEGAKTHDPLWNAAHTEMVKTGLMHNYMRVYWAKKILKWSDNIEDALLTAIHLNDKYSLDGRDPNGYTAIANAIGSVHDSPCPEKNIFGLVRSITIENCKKIFDLETYISKVNRL